MSALKAHGAGPLPGYGASNRSPLPTQHNVVPFSGIIAATTFDHKVAFVRLDAPAPAEFAVISSTTEGRVNLMNGHGRLEKKSQPDNKVCSYVVFGQQVCEPHDRPRKSTVTP